MNSRYVKQEVPLTRRDGGYSLAGADRYEAERNIPQKKQVVNRAECAERPTT